MDTVGTTDLVSTCQRPFWFVFYSNIKVTLDVPLVLRCISSCQGARNSTPPSVLLRLVNLASASSPGARSHEP